MQISAKDALGRGGGGLKSNIWWHSHQIAIGHCSAAAALTLAT